MSWSFHFQLKIITYLSYVYHLSIIYHLPLGITHLTPTMYHHHLSSYCLSSDDLSTFLSF